MAGSVSTLDGSRAWAQCGCSNEVAAGAEGCSPLRATGSPRIRFKVSAGIFSKASLVGAKSVNWPSPSSRVLSPDAATAACGGRDGQHECSLKALGFSRGKRQRPRQSSLRGRQAFVEAQGEKISLGAGPLAQVVRAPGS